MSVTELRRHTIGGSDAAAACGVDPYRSRVMLWAEKTGRVERPETEAMAWGKLLEPLVFAELERRGYDVMPGPGDALRDARRKWLTGTPDGFVVLAGVRGVLEVKTANTWAHRAAGDVPIRDAAQIQHYLHLTGLDRALLAVLVGGQRLEVREVERDDEAIALMLELEHDFYDHLRRDKLPTPDGSKSAREALIRLFPEAESMKVVRLDREHWRIREEYLARKAQRKAIAKQEAELQNQLMAFMGDAELAISPHDTDAISWASYASRRFDVTRLREERPEIADEFTSVTITRRFTLL